jgi:2-iminobutanoate/2-iminopropanoate deaminase
MALFLKDRTALIAVIATALIGFAIGHLPGRANQHLRGKEVVSFPDAPPSKAPFSTAIRAGDYVFCSGVIGTDLKTNELVSPDVGGQTRQCLQKIRSILAQAHLDLGDVVNATVYLSDINDYDAMNEVYSSFFPADPPARACVQAGKLVHGGRVEIAMMAWKAK